MQFTSWNASKYINFIFRLILVVVWLDYWKLARRISTCLMRMAKRKWWWHHVCWIFIFTSLDNELVLVKSCLKRCWSVKTINHINWLLIVHPINLLHFYENTTVIVNPMSNWNCLRYFRVSQWLLSIWFSGLEQTIPQMNNFVIYEGFFSNRPSANGRDRLEPDNSNNGLTTR